jgi:phosphinothricin acetyltransferase
MGITLRRMTDEDWSAVRAIFQEGIESGHATFETRVPEWPAWDAGHLRVARVVASDGQRVVGWAALSPVSRRNVYAGVVEVSLYVGASARGQGVGKALLTRLIELSEEAGLWTLQAGIFPENLASLALHRSCGFRQVGRRERLGQVNGVWRDVILLERRSQTVGAG